MRSDWMNPQCIVRSHSLSAVAAFACSKDRISHVANSEDRKKHFGKHFERFIIVDPIV